ncbi:hypothetical protein ACQEVZ_49170 [Dactylosporangium sp. CA-152071]|uniref:hypothetical protein n=1 Tax=Dactylosporangium sp. CA-152071 TaxID=3239933 RepID=UPI003D8A8FCE
MSDSGSMSNDSVSSSMSTSMSSSSGADSRGDQHSDAPAQTTASTAADHDHDFHYYVTSPREPSGDDTTADAATGSPIGDGGQTGVTHPADGEKPAGYSTGVQDHGAVASVPTQHDKDVATWMEQEAQIAKALAQQAELPGQESPQQMVDKAQSATGR